MIRQDFLDHKTPVAMRAVVRKGFRWEIMRGSQVQGMLHPSRCVRGPRPDPRDAPSPFPPGGAGSLRRGLHRSCRARPRAALRLVPLEGRPGTSGRLCPFSLLGFGCPSAQLPRSPGSLSPSEGLEGLALGVCLPRPPPLFLPHGTEWLKISLRSEPRLEKLQPHAARGTS